MGQGELRVGTSGYQYNHWREILYPADLPTKRWFEHYAQQFDTVEINNTFYNLPAASVFDDWRERAPPNFRFALKFSRYGTHMKKLKDPDEPIQRFIERAERLKAFLGPILVQLPPRWRVDAGRLAAFLQAAPRRHRWAVEMRDESWLCDPVYKVLERHNAALCIHDLVHGHPWRMTADWAYLRFHGTSQRKYSGDYSPQKLAALARRLARLLHDGRDVYAYFNNDAEGHAVKNAASLREYVRRRL